MEDNHINQSKPSPYEDIMNLPRPVSRTHVPMSIYDRAAQFSPFAALTGYDGEIKEAARLTNQRVELDETEKNILNEKLQIIQDTIEHRNELVFTYFMPDEKKQGGLYVSVNGIVKKIDPYDNAVILIDGTRILIEDLIEINGDIFNKVEGV